MTDTTNTPLGDEGLIVRLNRLMRTMAMPIPNDGWQGQTHVPVQLYVGNIEEAHAILALLASRNTASVPVGEVEKVVAAEREACALVCDRYVTPWGRAGSMPDACEGAALECGRRIRARAAPNQPPVEQPSIPEGMAVWQGGDSAPEDWDQNEPVKRRSGAMNMVSPDVPTAWLHDDFPQSDIIAYTPCPKPSEQPAVRVEISEEDVEQLFWKWWHGDRPEGDGPAAGFHAGYRAALTAALGKGDRT